MRLSTNTLIFGGWSGSLILVLFLLISEIGSGIIGGDWGAFIYVTLHFVLIPFFSIAVLLVTIFKVYKLQKQVQKIITVTSVVIPLMILYLTITGSTLLSKFLKVNF